MSATLEDDVHDAVTQRLDANGVAKPDDVELDTLQKNPAGENVQKGLAVLVDRSSRLFTTFAQNEIAVRRRLDRPNRGLDDAGARVRRADRDDAAPTQRTESGIA